MRRLENVKNGKHVSNASTGGTQCFATAQIVSLMLYNVIVYDALCTKNTAVGIISTNQQKLSTCWQGVSADAAKCDNSSWILVC